MLFQPTSQQRRRRMALQSTLMCIILSCVSMLSLKSVSASVQLEQPENAGKLAGELSQRQLLADNSSRIADASMLLKKLMDAWLSNSTAVEFQLEQGTFSFSTPLDFNISVTLQGVAINNSPQTILRCDNPDMTSLINFTGTQLTLSGVQLQDCSQPGLRISSTMPASITIEDSVFTKFTRNLGPKPLIPPDPAQPEGITDSTAALAVYAVDFAGNLTVRNSQFISNSFVWSEDRRRLFEEEGAEDFRDVALPWDMFGSDEGYHMFNPRGNRLTSQGRQPLDRMAARIDRYKRMQRMLAAETRPGLYLGGDMFGSSWTNFVGRRVHSKRSSRRRVQEVKSNTYSMPYLSNAARIHSGLQAGPWADDYESTISVICGGRQKQGCNVRFSNVNISDNQGVATSGLYVMCDGASSCDVELVNCAVRDNRLTRQPSYEFDEYWRDRRLEDYYSAPPGSDGMEHQPAGMKLFSSMVPWITYTYPLIEYFSTDGTEDVLSNPSVYPAVTGRTLGAVVFHQRNSPWPGARPEDPAMMRVRIVNCSFSGNDGSAIMSTATDFMQMAGGNATWSGDAPRHSVDFTMYNLYVTDHGSEWPAVWLRWARNVAMSKCTVTNSTGAVWLDEVRDAAVLEESIFINNTLSHLWLDYIGFIAKPLLEGSGASAFAGASHVVKIQMTPLGDIENRVTVHNCRFRGNPSFMTGVLYITASDISDIDENNQPGTTIVTVDGTNFTSNTCMQLVTNPSGVCETGERALQIINVHTIAVQACRFSNNQLGGVFLNSVYSATVSLNSTFEGNRLTCTIADGNGDNSFGGAALGATKVGKLGLTVLDSMFRNNTARVGGGAVYLRDFYAASFSNCRFEQNRAETFDGGAIWLDVCDGTIPALKSVTFYGNSAGRNGGAVCANNLAPGLDITDSTFLDNTALLDPADRGPRILDQAGGGAVFAYITAMISVTDSVFNSNKVLGHAGGAVRVVDSKSVKLTSCKFGSNMAIMGGAVAVSRLSMPSTLLSCEFTNNSALNSWASDSRSASVPSTSFIDPGYGGAMYAYSAEVLLEGNQNFVGNTAKFGGAIAVMSSPRFSIMTPGSYRDEVDMIVSTLPVPQGIAEAAGVPKSDAALLPYQCRFQKNVALIGGALYLFQTESVNFKLEYSSGTYAQYASHPPVLFYNNTANGGGAIYLEGNGEVNMSRCRFAANNALVPPLPANYGLLGREKDYATAKAHACYNGGGGALCVVGQASHNVSLVSSDLIMNVAKDGAGIYLSEGLDCIQQPGCYQMVLANVDMTGNNATSRGGGIFWMHEGVLQIPKCRSDKIEVYTTDGRSLYDPADVRLTNATSRTLYNVSFLLPKRKAPADYYGQLPVSKQESMLARVGGPVRASSKPVRVLNGSLVSEKQVLYAANASSSAVEIDSQGRVVVAKGSWLTGWGELVPSNAHANDSSSKDWIAADGASLLLSGETIHDAAWYGVNYTNLPCESWRNMAGTGSDLSTTPYFLLTAQRMDFYTSNTDVKINVTVHDWLGYPCVGDNANQPMVIVQADSPEVSGAVTMPAVNGTASFTSLRLRAKEGVHKVNMTGQLYSPVRQLIEAEVQIYVRPCAINEFLSPKNLDECIPCDYGSYNLNMSAVSCQPCPDHATCAFPDPMACKSDNCSTVGFMVPDDGYWQVNFFSQQVLECPNSDSCTYKNRFQNLSQIQLRVWQIARAIQLNASNTVANASAVEALKKLLASNYGLRRLLQEKALSDGEDIALVLNATSTMMPEYSQAQCAEGYTGTLCGECLPGYGWRKIATCGKCPSQILNNLYYALVTLLTLSVLAFTVYSSLKEQRMPGRLVGGVNDKGKSRAGPRISPTANGVGPGPNSSPSTQGPVPQFGSATMARIAPVEAVSMVLDQSPPREAQPDAGFNVSDYEYVDPVVAAARGQYASAPGTPKNGSQLFVPQFEPSGRSQSVVGVPLKGGPMWNILDERRKVPMGWSSASYSVVGPAGPVAEGRDYNTTNMLFDDQGNLSLHPDESEGDGEVGHEEIAPAVENMASESLSHPMSRTNPAFAVRTQQPTFPSFPSMVQPRFQSVTQPRCQQVAQLRFPSVTQPPFPPGVMLQSVPMMRGSPLRTPWQESHVPASPSPLGLEPQPAPPPERNNVKEHVRRRSMYTRHHAHQSTIVKIFVSYIQVLALLQNVPLDIPGVVDVYYRINNQAISYPGILVSLDCSLPDDSPVSKAIVRVILTVLAPLYIFAGAIIYFLVYNVLDYYVISPYLEKHKTRRRRKRQLRMPTFRMHMDVYLGRQLVVTFITIFFFFYPSVVQSLMTIFNCQDVNSSGPSNPLADGLGLQTDKVWSQDFGLECYKGPHLGLTLGLGIPGVLLIAIGWPLMSALFMTGKLHCMNNIRFTEDMTDFFLADFKPKYAWWESIIMLRKLLIAVIVTLLDAPTSAGVQLLLVVCVLVVAMGIHLFTMPYRHMYTNNLELFSLGTLLFTLYFSLYFSFSSSISDGGRITISVLILVVNIAMICAFVYYIIQAYYYAALYKTGLGELDHETRRKLTQAELQRRIYENLTQVSTTSAIQDNPRTHEERASYQHVASLYAAAVWASMRVGSTTNKMLTRVRTMLDAPPLSRPPSREGSQSGVEASDPESAPRKDSRRHRTSRDDPIAEDPESGLGSAPGSRRSSNAGIVAAEAAAGRAAAGNQDGNSAVNGKGAASASTTGSALLTGTTTVLATADDSASGSGSSAGTTAGRPPQVMAPRDTPVAPPDVSPKALAAGASQVAGGGAGTLTPVPPALAVSGSLPPVVAAHLVTSGSLPHRSSGSGVRLQSRLAVASNQSPRNDEMLPPPPSFFGH